MELDDQNIALGLNARNRQVYEMIFLTYKRPVLNFCFRILSNRADAEDVTQEVFIAVCSKNYSYDPKAKFSTWLFTIARNNCLSRLRKRKAFSSFWFSGSDGQTRQWDVPDPGESTGDTLERAETADHIKKAVDQLPLEQKEAIILREYHSLSYDEIAQILGCSLEKVKILIFRAREKLRDGLRPFIKENYYGQP